MTHATLDAMWSAVASRKRVLLKYLAKKAELMGLDRLAWYDLQAPLPQAAGLGGERLSYDEACGHVLATFNGFSHDFGAFAESALYAALDRGREPPREAARGILHVFPDCARVADFHDVHRLGRQHVDFAHELGHAYHSHLLREQPLFLQDYPMNLAETASTFAEAVLNERRLEAAQADAVRSGRALRDEQLVLLDGMLGDAVVYLMNIHARFLFEDRFCTERKAGEVPPARLSQLMQAAQKDAFCDGLDEEGWYPNFWISKLHFYMSSLPFYNFPYTFGYLLSLGIYAMQPDLGDQFAERYGRFLLATGCNETEAAVKSTLGCDLTQPTFWNKSLDIVERRVERFLELADESAS